MRRRRRTWREAAALISRSLRRGHWRRRCSPGRRRDSPVRRTWSCGWCSTPPAREAAPCAAPPPWCNSAGEREGARCDSRGAIVSCYKCTGASVRIGERWLKVQANSPAVRIWKDENLNLNYGLAVEIKLYKINRDVSPRFKGKFCSLFRSGHSENPGCVCNQRKSLEWDKECFCIISSLHTWVSCLSLDWVIWGYKHLGATASPPLARGVFYEREHFKKSHKPTYKVSTHQCRYNHTDDQKPDLSDFLFLFNLLNLL